MQKWNCWLVWYHCMEIFEQSLIFCTDAPFCTPIKGVQWLEWLPMLLYGLITAILEGIRWYLSVILIWFAIGICDVTLPPLPQFYWPFKCVLGKDILSSLYIIYKLEYCIFNEFWSIINVKIDSYSNTCFTNILSHFTHCWFYSVHYFLLAWHDLANILCVCVCVYWVSSLQNPFYSTVFFYSPETVKATQMSVLLAKTISFTVLPEIIGL